MGHLKPARLQKPGVPGDCRYTEDGGDEEASSRNSHQFPDGFRIFKNHLPDDNLFNRRKLHY